MDDTTIPLVSIVTPAYNAKQFIEDTLRSVMVQKYPRIEHIVLDDGSTDNTAEILRSYEDKYNLRWQSKPNEGQAATVNKGFDMARGQIVVWLNADDVLFDKTVLSKAVEVLSNRSVGVAYGHLAVIDEKNRLQKIQYAPPRLDFDILSIAHFTPCIFFRREIAASYKLNPHYKYALDYDQALRIAKDGVRFAFIDQPLIAWRRHSAAKTITGNEKMMRETEEILFRYSTNTGVKQGYMKMLLYPFVYARKLYGMRDVLRLLKNHDNLRLAFPIEFDSVQSLVLRQVLPFS